MRGTLRRSLLAAASALALLFACEERALADDASPEEPPVHGVRPLPVLPAPVAAPALPARERLHYRNITLIRLNPLGLFNEARLGYRRRLYDSDSLVARDNFVGMGGSFTVTPALTRIGANVELQPLSVLSLSAQYEGIFHFGNFNFLQSYASPNAEHSDSDLKAGGEAGQNYASAGRQLTLQALVQGKVGDVAARNTLRVAHMHTVTEPGDRVFYDIYFDVLAPADGWILANDADLLYLGLPKLTLGARHSLVHALYGPEHYAPGEPALNPNTPIHRVGPLVSYTFYDEPGATVNTPTITLLAQWWLDHRYRTGQDVSQAMPYVVLAFSFTGDLL